ncbi:MAG: pantoate--beta-alanine ligase, partial [Bacteroidota bacterium]
MKVVHSIDDFQALRPTLRGSLGLVPTMGALHEGHASLVRQSLTENEKTVVSIFVNPTQFGPNEDYEQYPRRLEQDAELLAELGVDFIFAPRVQDIYTAGKPKIRLEIDQLDQVLCAKSRPGHLNGVLQIVSILFHLVQPDRAYFGLKDYQQQLIIQSLVKELHFPLAIVPCPLVRKIDGLALSSRNRYLTEEEGKQATALSGILAEVKLKRENWKSIAEVHQMVEERLKTVPLVKLDYFEIL